MTSANIIMQPIGWLTPEYKKAFTHCRQCGKEMKWTPQPHGPGFDPFSGEILPTLRIFGCIEGGKSHWMWREEYEYVEETYYFIEDNWDPTKTSY